MDMLYAGGHEGMKINGQINRSILRERVSKGIAANKLTCGTLIRICIGWQVIQCDWSKVRKVKYEAK